MNIGIERKHIFIGFLSLAFIIAALFVYGVATSSVNSPKFPPPLNDPNTEYRIVKEGENYLIEYRKKGETLREYVGTSKVDLAKYVNKKVKIEGENPIEPGATLPATSNTQCIAGKCRDIFHPKFWESENQSAVIVNINSILPPL